MDKREQTKRWVEEVLNSFGIPFSDLKWTDIPDGSCMVDFISNGRPKNHGFTPAEFELIADGNETFCKKEYSVLLDLIRQ